MLQKFFDKNTISLDPGQARNIVWPDLGSNFLQKLSADDTNRYIVKIWWPIHCYHAEFIFIFMYFNPQFKFNFQVYIITYCNKQMT